MLEWSSTLGSHARRARQGSWWPLCAAGAVALAAAPLYLPAGGHHAPSTLGAPGSVTSVLLSGMPIAHPLGAAAFWLVTVPAWYLACAIYYRRRAARTGYHTSPWLWAVAGVVLFGVLAASVPVAGGLHLGPGYLPWLTSTDLVSRGIVPLSALVLVLPLLAWAERSLPLVVIWGPLAGAALFADLYDLSNLFGNVGPRSAGRRTSPSSAWP